MDLFHYIRHKKIVGVPIVIKKRKSQIERLKEKIRNQNVDIEEALKRLSVMNRN